MQGNDVNFASKTFVSCYKIYLDKCFLGILEFKSYNTLKCYILQNVPRDWLTIQIFWHPKTSPSHVHELDMRGQDLLEKSPQELEEG